MVIYVCRWEKVVKNFVGKYSRSLDPKGRLLLPSKLELSQQKSLYVLRGFDGCLSIFTLDGYEAYLTQLSSLRYTDEASRAYVRLASMSVEELPIDSHGRILLGKSLLEEYSIGNEVVLIGVLDHLELWDKNKLESYVQAQSPSFEGLASRSQ